MDDGCWVLGAGLLDLPSGRQVVGLFIEI